MQLRVWYIKNIPGQPTHYHVDSLEEAKKVLQELIDRDSHDSSVTDNAMGLEEFDGEEWLEWYDEDGNDIFELLLVEKE